VGFIVPHKVGDWVEAGEVLVEIHANRAGDVELARQRLLQAFSWSEAPQPPLPSFLRNGKRRNPGVNMLARVYSCAVIGLEGVIIEVEVDYTAGMGGMVIVGLPDAAVQESRERVQTAIRNASLAFPRRRVVVNLAPASVRKEGAAYDLPIALGVLVLTGVIPAAALEGTLVVGELSLDGQVRHVRGVLPMARGGARTGLPPSPRPPRPMPPKPP
jgi:hypothetical protein